MDCLRAHHLGEHLVWIQFRRRTQDMHAAVKCLQFVCFCCEDNKHTHYNVTTMSLTTMNLLKYFTSAQSRHCK
jgi:hypothetical protein